MTGRKTNWKDIEFTGMRHARETAAALLDDKAALLAALREIVATDEAHDGKHRYAAIARAAIAKAAGAP